MERQPATDGQRFHLHAGQGRDSDQARHGRGGALMKTSRLVATTAMFILLAGQIATAADARGGGRGGGGGGGRGGGGGGMRSSGPARQGRGGRRGLRGGGGPGG